MAKADGSLCKVRTFRQRAIFYNFAHLAREDAYETSAPYYRPIVCLLLHDEDRSSLCATACVNRPSNCARGSPARERSHASSRRASQSSEYDTLSDARHAGHTPHAVVTVRRGCHIFIFLRHDVVISNQKLNFEQSPQRETRSVSDSMQL